MPVTVFMRHKLSEADGKVKHDVNLLHKLREEHSFGVFRKDQRGSWAPRCAGK